METIYRSKVGVWFYLAIGVAGGAVLLATWQIVQARGAVGIVAISPALIIGLGLPIWMLMSTCYTVTATQLLIKCGPLRVQVPISEISRITPTSNMLSSPALSLDRLLIEYSRGKSVMISPKNKEAFLHEIEAKRAAKV